MGTIFEMRGGDGDQFLSPCHALIWNKVFRTYRLVTKSNQAYFMCLILSKYHNTIFNICVEYKDVIHEVLNSNFQYEYTWRNIDQVVLSGGFHSVGLIQPKSKIENWKTKSI